MRMHSFSPRENVVTNTSIMSPVDTPELGKPQFASHAWLEPFIVVSIMVSSLIINRCRNFSILDRQCQLSYSTPLLDDDSTSEDCLTMEFQPDTELVTASLEIDNSDGNSNTKSKQRNCFGCIVRTPNSRRFRNHYHSRFLQKFPFLIEMFYWALTYSVYSITKGFAESFYTGKGNGVVELAQSHGINILSLEHDSTIQFLFPLKEVDVQKFFLQGHSSVMTLLNRAYSLIHIPGTILFLSWYYYSAPNHDTFAVCRRTMTLGNFVAFIIFCFWPCMPPRLLPDSFGFHDTVRQGNAESVWVGGKNVNELAAMPSLHFTYAFVIGCTFVYHSGVLGRILGTKERVRRQPVGRQVAFFMAGIIYPIFVLLVIVATANHYYMDAVMATFTVILSFLCNKIWNVLLPAEDWLCWVLRLEKPVPTTGMRYSEETSRPKVRQREA